MKTTRKSRPTTRRRRNKRPAPGGDPNTGLLQSHNEDREDRDNSAVGNGRGVVLIDRHRGRGARDLPRLPNLGDLLPVA